MRRPTFTVLAAATALLALTAVPAAAHITANPNSLEADGRGATSLAVPHGCAGSPTHTVEVAIPDEVESVTPEQLGGWTAEITDDSVIWTADDDSLPDDQYREFGLRLVLPDLPDEVLWFPTIQTCDDDSEEAWIEIPDDLDGWDDLDYPAPYVELTASTGDGHGNGDEGHDDEAADGDESDAVGEEADADAGADDADNAADELAAEPAAAEDASIHPVTWIALAVGILGLLLGGGALAASRRRN